MHSFPPKIQASTIYHTYNTTKKAVAQMKAQTEKSTTILLSDGNPCIQAADIIQIP